MPLGTNTHPWGVKGLTDSPRIPIVAKAKIGEKGERGEPRRLDYIVFVEPQSGRRLHEYQAVFGERPTYFDALLSGDRVEDMVDVAWKRFGRKGLKCRGDGERGYDRETGEERQCAGSYDFDDQTRHLCPYARPQGEKPPECKPVLSMRLVVPQIPGLGVVQLDTGAVASSIPTLIAQLRMIEAATEGHMAGIAVRVLIRAFPDRFGNAAYSWQLEPLREQEADALRHNIEGLVRIEGQIPKVLPPIEETPDADIYGIAEVAEGRQLPASVGERPEDAEPGECMGEGTYPAGAEPLEVGLPGEVVEAELALRAAMRAAKVPLAKAESIQRLMETNREKASQTGTFDGYIDWLRRQVARIEPQAEEGQG